MVEQRQKLLDQLHAYDGAIQFARELLAEISDESTDEIDNGRTDDHGPGRQHD